jgi:hypothetical protein
MKTDLRVLSMEKHPLLKGWKKSNNDLHMGSLWDVTTLPVLKERYFHGKDEIRISAILLESIEKRDRIIKSNIQAFSALSPDMPVERFADGNIHLIGRGLCVPSRVNCMYIEVWFFEKEIKPLLSSTQVSQLLLSIAKEMKKRAKSLK